MSELLRDLISNKDVNPDEVDAVIYHHPCADGTASAYVAWKYYRENFPEKELVFYPMSIGAAPPHEIEGKNVLICDYSYRKEILIDLLKKVNKLLIIDHHKSSEKELTDIDEKHKIFHMQHSGCFLTWRYFYPEVDPPLMIKYIQDVDIWTKKLPYINEFQSWFHTLPLEFSEYDKYIDDKQLLEHIVTKGVTFNQLNEHYIDQSLEHATPRFSRIKDKYYIVGYLNKTICKSEIGNKIFTKFPLIDFSAVYSISNSDYTYFSLRSTNNHVDVSEVATKLSGGGHRNASGIKLEYVTNHLPGAIFDTGNLYDNLKNIYYGVYLISDKLYNIVYLASSVHKHKIGKYLLQTKYIHNTKEIQTCQDISYKLGHENSCPNNVDISAIWSYNPADDQTVFSITFHPKMNYAETSALSTYLQLEKNNTIVYNGIHKFLTQ